MELPAPPAGWPAETGQRTAVRRMPVRRIVAVLLILALAGGGYALYRLVTRTAPNMDVQLFTVARRSFPIVLKEKGELKAANSIDIRSELEGRATIISLVSEGQRVKEGDLLIELASDTIDDKIRDTESLEAKATADYEAALKTRDIGRDESASKVRKAELQLKLAKLAQEKYIEGEQKEAEQEATLAVEKAEMVLQREEQDYKDAQELFDQGFITRIELADAKFNHYAAGLDVAKAKLALEVLKRYTVPMDLEEKASAVHEAEKELERERKAAEASEAKDTADVDAKKSELDITREKLAKYRDQKSKSKILAPAPGLVVYAREGWWRSEPTIETGVEVHERQLLLQLPDTSTMKVEVRVHEAQIERLEEGMMTNVEIEGFPGRQFTGKVSKIAVMADSQNMFLNPNLREYKTEVLLDGTYSDLKPNTTARVEIQIAQLSNVLAVPVQAVFAKTGKFFVFQDMKGTVKPVQIEPGLSSTEFVEVKSGLQESQSIRLAVSDEMKLLLPDEGDSSSDEESGRRDRPKSTADAIVRAAASRPAASRPAAEPSRPERSTDKDERNNPGSGSRRDHRGTESRPSSSEKTDSATTRPAR